MAVSTFAVIGYHRPIAHGHGRRAFTLLELLVVLAIIGVLIGLLLPAVQAARESAARAACSSNLRQLALASHQYEASFGILPPGCKSLNAPDSASASYVTSTSWLTLVLPYVEQEALYRQALQAITDDPSVNESPHEAVSLRIVAVFLCPAEGRRLSDPANGQWALKTYVGVAGTGLFADDGIFHYGLEVRLTGITDGTSNTVVIGERPPGPRGYGGAWYTRQGCTCPSNAILPATDNPPLSAEARNCTPVYSAFAPGRIDNGCDLSHFWGQHRRGANFAFADGSVRFLSYGVADILPALATRAGGESVEVP
ncbi:MAG: DUF1559 domain-containing protein, partial [Gemmataceae bacterium]|nr:DUF1559 domain-containing protein [Gemmataceae bacterium]